MPFKLPVWSGSGGRERFVVVHHPGDKLLDIHHSIVIETEKNIPVSLKKKEEKKKSSKVAV